MQRLFFLFTLLLAPVLVVGCTLLNQPELTPTPPTTATETITPAPAITPSATPEGPITLRIWLPPQFDPQTDTLSGRLLQARLNEFAARRPRARVEVRVKSQEGPGSLLDALTTANASAPLALPDLIALPRPLLEAAALKGLLVPLDDLSDSLDDGDWYTYARELGQLQNSTFGLPFAGNALIMVYRPAIIPTPPAMLTGTLQLATPLAFPAADPQALLTLALYEAAGGPTLDNEGRPMLDVDVLTTVLEYYQRAAAAEVLPFWLTQFQSDAQVWQAYTENQTDLAITWTSRYLETILADSSVALLPTISGEPYTLATGWVWALVSPNPEHRKLSVELAEFLTESSFMASWTSSIHYLPPRPSALPAWQSTALLSLAEQVELSAHLYPSADILTTLAPHLQQATIEVLKNQTEPRAAAQQAAQNLTQP